MSSHRAITGGVALAATASLSLLFTAAPVAHAAPDSDSQGYVDSTASCTSPATVVLFGSTGTSRVAICREPDGQYQYRGVRVRDGARLILPAQRSSDGSYTADNDGIEYSVSPSALVLSAGERLIREEPMLDFNAPGISTTPKQATTPTTTTPLPPPLPAEVGAAGS